MSEVTRIVVVAIQRGCSTAITTTTRPKTSIHKDNENEDHDLERNDTGNYYNNKANNDEILLIL